MPSEKGNWKQYTIRGTIPANSSNTTLTKQIDGQVIFRARQIRGTFTTLQDNGSGATVDYGVNALTFRIIEGGNDYQFIDNYTPVDMMLTPGRRKSPLATNNDTSPDTLPVFEPVPFHHDFYTEIQIPVVNNSDRDQEIEISFIGYECKR